MHHHTTWLISGRHSTILAINSDDVLPKWTILKVVSCPLAGRSNGSKPHDALQEARLLGKLSHPNIIQLMGYNYDTNLHEHHLQLPFLPLTLAELLQEQLLPVVIQSILFQTLLALAHIHADGIAHRDINPNNIMIDWDGTVKVIDFGVAWTGGDIIPGDEKEKAWYETPDEMICDVGTGRWRAPELLFSPTTYDAAAIDLWALGVIMTDMYDHTPICQDGSDDGSEEELRDPLEEDDHQRMSRKPIFRDDFGDIGLAGSIFRVLGTPTEDTWPEFNSLPDAGKIDFIHCDPQPLGSMFPDMDSRLSDLMTRLLQLSPSRRISAKEALEHQYFDGTMVPQTRHAWFGTDLRVDVSARCIEEKDGRRLVDHLAEYLEVKKEIWDRS